MVIRLLSEDNHDFTTSPAGTRIQEGDEAFFERNRAYWFNTVGTIIAAVQSKLPYPQMYGKLEELGQRIDEKAQADPDGTFTALMFPAVHRIYVLTTRLQTHFNALRTGIEIYLVKARTGRLPDSVLAGTPPDLFSGQPFIYEKSDSGFVLRCQVKESAEKPEANRFEFTIK